MSETIKETRPATPRRWRPSFGQVDWRPRLRWFAAEFLVIVTGILCAFAINSWAGQRADRRVETSYLAALEADFDGSRSDLEAVISVAEESMAAARQLLRYTALGPERAPLDSALWSAGRFRGFNTFAPTTGAYDNLILSGDVALIRSDSLREALAAWGGMLARNRVLEGVMIEQYHGHTPFMRERLAFRELPLDGMDRGLPLRGTGRTSGHSSATWPSRTSFRSVLPPPRRHWPTISACSATLTLFCG